MQHHKHIATATQEAPFLPSSGTNTRLDPSEKELAIQEIVASLRQTEGPTQVTVTHHFGIPQGSEQPATYLPPSYPFSPYTPHPGWAVYPQTTRYTHHPLFPPVMPTTTASATSLGSSRTAALLPRQTDPESTKRPPKRKGDKDGATPPKPSKKANHPVIEQRYRNTLDIARRRAYDTAVDLQPLLSTPLQTSPKETKKFMSRFTEATLTALGTALEQERAKTAHLEATLKATEAQLRQST